jgi:hypothetical protein
MSHERITQDGAGLDEILLDGVDIHIERMDKGTVWLGITRSGKPNQRLSVVFSARGNSLRAKVSDNEIGVPSTPKS